MAATYTYTRHEDSKTESIWMITGYKSESNDYLYGSVNCDKRWMHHYLSETVS